MTPPGRRRHILPRAGPAAVPAVFFLAMLLLAVPASPAAGQEREGGPPGGAVIVEGGTEVVRPAAEGTPLPDGGFLPGARTRIDLTRFRETQQTVADVLRTVPGITVTQGGDAMAPTKVRIRGGRADQVLVVLDGVALDFQTDNPAAGRAENRQGVDLSTLTLERVASIEIVRGAATSLYGPGAAAGAVIINTRRGGPQRVRLSQTVGPGNFGETSGELVAPTENQTWRYHFNHRQTGGEYVFYDPDFATQAPATPESELCAPSLGDGYRLRKCNARRSDALGVAWSGAGRRQWSLDLQSHRSEGGGGIWNPQPYARENRLQALTAYADAWPLEQGRLLGLDLHGKRLEGEHTSNATAEAGVLENFHAETRADGDLWYERWAGPHQFRLGGAATGERLRDFFFDAHRTQSALYGRWNGHLPGGSLEASLRGESLSGLGPRTTYRLGASHYLGNHFGIKASRATGFRPPTLYELHDPGSPESGPSPANPNLLPEDSLSTDGGFFWERKPWFYAEVLGFEQQVVNDIVFAADPANPNLPLFQNLPRTRTLGTESSANLRFPRGVGLNLTHTRMDARIAQNPNQPETVGNQVPGVPEQEWHAGLDWRAGGWRGYLNVRHRGARFIDSENASFLVAYRLVDAGLAFPLGGGWRGLVAAKNLTNRAYSELENYPAPGREIFFTLRWESGGPAPAGGR